MKHINTLHQHMDMTADSIEFIILVEIIDTIIGDIFFCNDEQLFDVATVTMTLQLTHSQAP